MTILATAWAEWLLGGVAGIGTLFLCFVIGLVMMAHPDHDEDDDDP